MQFSVKTNQSSMSVLHERRTALVSPHIIDTKKCLNILMSFSFCPHPVSSRTICHTIGFAAYDQDAAVFDRAAPTSRK